MDNSEFKARWKSGIQATLLREPKRNALITGAMAFIGLILLIAGAISPWVAVIVVFLNPAIDLVRAITNSYRLAKSTQSEQDYQEWLTWRAKNDQERPSPSNVPLNWYGWYRQSWPENKLRTH